MKESIQLTGKKMAFRQRRSSNSIILLLLLTLVVASLFLLRGVLQKDIKSPFEPTPLPTRTVNSYVLEAETHFTSGNLDEAVKAYTEAIKYDPSNTHLYSVTARIQAYSSATLATDTERYLRMQEAMKSIDAAKSLTPENSEVLATRAFVLDWLASAYQATQTNKINVDNSVENEYLSEAFLEAGKAINLDNKNASAYAYYAEILLDQQKWVQADQNITLAMQIDPNLMDVHRIRALIQETGGNYAEAIKEYKEAAKIDPNLTFLYIRIGINYRQLRQYDEARNWFQKAIDVNSQIGVKDPTPYLAKARTLMQMQNADFYNAAFNVRDALDLNPSNPEVYATLGVVYFKSRNYEGSIEPLMCAIKGCDSQTSCRVRENSDACTKDDGITITGMPLTSGTVVYYYTYGSVLAAMYTKANPDYCTRALEVLKQVRDAYSNDPSVMAIIEPSEQICANKGFHY